MAEPTEQASAKAALKAQLDTYGLGSLADWAWESYLSGVPVQQIMLDLRDRDEYKTRFKGLDELRKKGRGITEAEWVQYEQGAAALFRAHGFPEGFYDQPDDFARYITGEMSLKELDDRLQKSEQDMFDNVPAEVREQYARLYNVGPGEMTAMWLDEKIALPLLEKRRVASQIAGAAAYTKFGQLGVDQAERLAQYGVDPAQSGATFRTLAGMSELTTEFAGETDDVNQDTLLDAGFGNDAAATAQVERRARRRRAEYEQGGSYAGSDRGVTGLGSANT